MRIRNKTFASSTEIIPAELNPLTAHSSLTALRKCCSNKLYSQSRQPFASQFSLTYTRQTRPPHASGCRFVLPRSSRSSGLPPCLLFRSCHTQFGTCAIRQSLGEYKRNSRPSLNGFFLDCGSSTPTRWPCVASLLPLLCVLDFLSCHT